MSKFLKLVIIFLISSSVNLFSSDIKLAEDREKKAYTCFFLMKKYKNVACLHIKESALDHLATACEIYYSNYMSTGNDEYLNKTNLNYNRILKILKYYKQRKEKVSSSN